jgi:shikimate kinase
MNSDTPSTAGAPAAGGNIFLVGLMGAGKTSVGKLLARRLGKSFCDCDQEIERATGVRIPIVFEIEGEAGFRSRERKMLAELTQRSGIVLATGGGAVLCAENREALKERGTVVYLCATPHELWQRTRHDRNRPLLHTPNPLAKLTALFNERDALYREVAHLVVDTGSQSVGALATRLEQKLTQLAGGGARAPEAQQRSTLDTKTCAP